MVNMTMSKWINEGGIFYPVGNFQTYPSPGAGVFNLVKNPNPMDGRLGLIRVSDKFEFPFKLYDLGTSDFLEKVKKTWNSEYFEENRQNLGIILDGVKGTGKTIAAKVLCNEVGLPVIVVGGHIPGMLEFISSLEFECIILLDEAEKMFSDDDPAASQALLKMIDGVTNLSRKLYILTTNSLEINENLLGRPGRIRYIKEFKNISEKCVKEYLNDNLIDKNMIEDVVGVVNSLEVSTIDTLRAIINEVNIHGKLTDITEFNLTFKSTYGDVIYMTLRGRDIGDREVEREFKTFRKYIDNNLGNKSIISWWYSDFYRKTDPKYIIPTDEDEDEDLKEEISVLSVKSTATRKKTASSSYQIYNYLRDKFNQYVNVGDLRFKGTKIYEGLQTNWGIVKKDLGGGWWIIQLPDGDEIRCLVEIRINNSTSYLI